ncbi:MAG: hypothetical protein HZA28_04895 [Candidatus Omnitrophica bacterium]|nr:hypothetical protein [Candidatus Omnitrophota bacterium]
MKNLTIIGVVIACLLPILLDNSVKAITLPPNYRDYLNLDYFERVDKATPQERVKLNEERLYNIEQREAHDNRVAQRLFMITLPIGMIVIVMGGVLRVGPIGSGLMLGGLLSIIHSYNAYWEKLPNELAVISLLPVLIMVVVTGSRITAGFLGVFDIGWSLFLLLMFALGTQLALMSYIFLGLWYLVIGIGLLNQNEKFKKVYLWGAIPLSILAAINVRVLGAENMPSYFYTPPKAQIEIIWLSIILPLLMNMVHLRSSRKRLQPL